MIKNIVYDFGFVMAYPRTGNWFIPPRFRKILGVGGCLLFLVKAYKIDRAFRTAHQYLNDNHLLTSEQEEFKQFTVFYERILADMGLRRNRHKKAALLAWDTVYNDEKVIFYPDVLRELKSAGESYTVAVLSDAWPSLKRIFEHRGIMKILNGLVMSCDYGICKNNIELFYKAASKFHIKPEETAFIDDSEENLDNAKKAGFLPIRMDRSDTVQESKYPLVHNLAEVRNIVDRYDQ